jgi:hypothetical protein
MKIYLSCSKRFFDAVPDVKESLEQLGHQVTPPNGWNDSDSEGLIRELDTQEHAKWKASMIRKNAEIISTHDAI